jgi:hypothetical protein
MSALPEIGYHGSARDVAEVPLPPLFPFVAPHNTPMRTMLYFTGPQLGETSPQRFGRADEVSLGSQEGEERNAQSHRSFDQNEGEDAGWPWARVPG